MTVITTRLIVAADGTFSGRTPELAPGEYEVSVTVCTTSAAKRFTMKDFPRHDEPWDGSVSLRREDMYDDEGRLL